MLTKKIINKAELFLRERNILLDSERWPINLSRDTHIKTKEEIVKAMEDFAKLAFEAGGNYRMACKNLTDGVIDKSEWSETPDFREWINND